MPEPTEESGRGPGPAWAKGYTDEVPEGRPDVVAVEVSPERDRYGIVKAWRVGEDRIMVRACVSASTSKVWDIVAEAGARQILLAPQLAIHYRGRQQPRTVGASELEQHLGGVAELIREGRLLHAPGDHALNDDVARSPAVLTARGLTLSNRLVGERLPVGVRRPIDCARAMVWAAGELLRSRGLRPRVITG